MIGLSGDKKEAMLEMLSTVRKNLGMEDSSIGLS